MVQEFELIRLIELTEHGDSSANPMVFRLIRRNGEPNHKVCRVSRCRKSSSSGRRLVNWAVVAWNVGYFGLLARPHPQLRHVVE